jgi:hypothetical protein
MALKSESCVVGMVIGVMLLRDSGRQTSLLAEAARVRCSISGSVAIAWRGFCRSGPGTCAAHGGLLTAAPRAGRHRADQEKHSLLASGSGGRCTDTCGGRVLSEKGNRKREQQRGPVWQGQSGLNPDSAIRLMAFKEV